jgi:hypothetical protein
MQNLIKELYDCLRNELLQYVALEELLQSEQLLVQSLNAQSLFDAVRQKETMTGQIAALEIQRKRIVAQLAARLGLPSDELNVSRLLEHLNPTGGKLLGALREQLRATIERVREETGKLEIRIRHSESLIDDTMSYIRQVLAGDSAPGYVKQSSAMRQGISATPSVVISRQI